MKVGSVMLSERLYKHSDDNPQKAGDLWHPQFPLSQQYYHFLPVFPSCRPLSRTRQLLPMRNRGYCRDACRPGAPSPPTPCKTIPYHWPLHELSASLHGYRVQLAENLSSALKEYFDPNSGRLQERLERRIPEVYPKSSMLRHRFQLGFGSGPAREPS